MEVVNPAIVISNDNRLYTNKLNSCFDEFLRLKPDHDVLGEVFFTLLQDATTSLVKSVAKSYDIPILADNTEQVVKMVDRYARLYFVLMDDTALLMFRSALYDLIRGYDYNSTKYDKLTSDMYESIRKLITV
jgi:hypothetical protein